MKPIKISKVLLLCAISLTLFNCSDSEELVTKTENVKEENEVTAASKIIINAPFGSGVNIQASYFNGGKNHIGYDLMNNYSKIKTVRIEIEPDKVSIATAKKWIQDAQNAGFQVIATYHDKDKLASNSISDLNGAANWWKARYDDLGGDFIINIMNEWGGHYLSSTTYGNAYDDAINIIRSTPGYGSTRPIIIDLPGYGQGATRAADAASLIHDGNYYFSAHIYRDAYNGATNSPLSAAHLDYLSNKHSKCIVGEFGYKTDVPNNVNVNNLVAWARGCGWPLFGWSWIRDDDSDMNMVKSNFGAPNNKVVNLTVNTANPYSVNQPYFNSIYGMLPN